MNEHEQCCMSFWLPRLEEAKIPTPATVLVVVDNWQEMSKVLDGKSSPEFDVLVAKLTEIVTSIAGVGMLPCFLRTGETSAKHYWRDTCLLERVEDIPAHVANIIEFSECCDFLGLAYGVWAIREMLPTTPLFRCSAYHEFPVTREYRFFVRNGLVECWHPYWPEDALEQGAPDVDDWRERAAVMREEPPAEACALARRVAGLFEDWWSVDLLETTRGWYVTDMARGERSWHMPGCPHDTRARGST